MASAVLRCGSRELDLSRPAVMGILNITPDSFSDGGRLFCASKPDLERVLRKACAMRRQGALIVDVGGESTRPGATAVDEQQELERVAPVVEAIAARVDIVISVDTSSPRVMREVAALGAGMINDVRALRRPGALQVVAAGGLAVCLMHMQGEPRTMQQAPEYGDVLAEVRDFLLDRVAACAGAGIAHERLVLDPGFGFGKTLDHNLSLFRGLKTLLEPGYPLLIGVSRKSVIGDVLRRPVARRLAGGLALATLAAAAGARLVRTHDVAATCDALAMVAATRDGWSGA
ncbi:MAG: dihydropteroate synthase [Gammaproteobacteria bacterium]|jgi:dihydropteroate synthase|nr:dihydropteroate synthase [Gammaproteobacteria bacterium]MBP6051607.1 dihydropteroate synthase [Pseudomonadales bacterium]MBK6581372.1 dihydropteroate synthase [Gammaproteobacteria bacterium]MBK7167817.1 dihydropteroate synthase [Gammaproteobacteria bacterium]MBK7518678.1 dihydropteroate synthase [Gammaproteobacteria bacterium]